MNQNLLIVKKRGNDGTRIISVRIREETLSRLDKIGSESNRSRNELINMFIDFAIENVKIE